MPGGGVQTIDVLRDQAAQTARGGRGGEHAVSVIGFGHPHGSPPQIAARPVTLPCRRAAAELAIRHRLTHRSVRAPVVGYSPIGGYMGAGEYDLARAEVQR